VIANNSVEMTNTLGDVITFSGGRHVDLFDDFKISDSVISGNPVRAEKLGSSPGFAQHGAAASSSRGWAAPASWVQFGVVKHSELRGNELRARTRDGEARVRGGGAVVDTPPELPGQAASP
jgi:hypothetical protein